MNNNIINDLIQEKKKKKKRKIPKKYLTKDAAAMKREIEKHRDKSDDDKSAYEHDGPWEADVDKKTGKRHKTKTSKHTKAFQKKFGESREAIDDLSKTLLIEVLSAKVKKALKNKAKKANAPYGAIKTVFNKGMAAWKTGHRPGVGQIQWAMARVNSFLTGGPARKTDKKEWQKVKKWRAKQNENKSDVLNLLNEEMFELQGSARFEEGELILTDDLNQEARAVLTDKIDISNSPWKITSIFYMTDNLGIRDVDIVGGDGIWFEFDERKLSFGLDTFKNEYNETGNELNIFIENQVVASQPCPVMFNNDKEHLIEISCNPIGSPTFQIKIDDEDFMEYDLETMDMQSLFEEEAEFSVFSFTGDAGSKQVVTSIEFQRK
jgi:hypothetical protein